MRETLARARSLVAQLARAFPGLGEDRAEEALDDAALDWWRSERPVPPPLGWLYQAGWSNARDVMKSEAALVERERRWGNERVLAGVASPEDELEARWRLEDLERVVAQLERALVDDPMRVVFRLWIGGVRATDVYARALGVDARPTGERGSLGEAGEGPGELQGVRGLAALPDGRLAVWTAHDRVDLFAADGTYLDSFSARLGSIVSGPGPAMLADAAGHLVFRTMEGPPSPSAPRVIRYAWVRYRTDGALVDSLLPPPRDIEGPPLAFRTETVATPSPLGYLVWGRNDRRGFTYRLADGRVVRVEMAHEPVRLEGGERDGWAAWLRTRGGAWRGDAERLPREKPAWGEVWVDADGRVWLARYGPAERRRPDDAEQAARSRSPAAEWIEPAAHDVFDPRGGLAGTVVLPEGSEPLFARGERVWVVETGAMDEPYVVRYRMRRAGGDG